MEEKDNQPHDMDIDTIIKMMEEISKPKIFDIPPAEIEPNFVERRLRSLQTIIEKRGKANGARE